MVNNAKFSVDEASLRYQALTKLADLAEDIASLRNPKKSVDKTLQATKIRLWLKALDLKNYLSREQRERIWYALICLSDVYDFPVAPVLSSVPRPAILLGNEYPSIITGLSNKVDRPGDTMTGDLNFTGAGINTADYVQFNTAYTDGIIEGRVQWNPTDQRLEVGLPGSNVFGDMTPGMVRVVNKTGASIARGKVVYINGGQGNRPTITLASNANEASSAKTFGITAEAIGNNQNGYVLKFGFLYDLNTSGFTAGQTLYLGTNGDFIGTKPSAPNHMVAVGKVINVSSTVGIIYTDVQNGFELEELHNVKITAPTNGVTLKYNTSTNLWENTTTPLVTGTGTINEIAYWDTAATIASLSTATYPSLTELSYVKGVTSGVQSQLNNKIPTTRTLTINGTGYDLSANRTWNVGTVTDVGLNVPTGFTVTNSPVTTAGNLTIGFASGYSLPTTASQANWDTAYSWGNHATAGYQLMSQKGLANGYASLDSAGKVPVSQLPSSIMEYKGTWNASTNTPTLANGVGDAGDVYRVTVAGIQNLGSGSISFEVGDYVIYNGTIWEKSDTTDSVASVFGRTGAVTAQSGDYNTSQVTENTNLYFTNARARQAISLTTTGTSGASTYDNGTGILNIPQYQPALTNPVTGTGTSGQVAYFNGTTSITSESNLFWDSTNDFLGIGTASPSEKLHLKNSAGTGCFVRFEDTSGGGVYIGGRAERMELYAGGSEAMRIFSSRNVFIGSSPSDAGYKLDVNGTGRFTGDVTINKTSPLIITDASSGAYYGGLSIRLAGTENVRFAANSTEGGYVYSPTAQWNGFSILNDATTFFRIASTGAATFSSSVTATQGIFGQTGSGSFGVHISNNDQSNVRLRLTNTGSGGQAFSIVGGNPGASNNGLAIYDETNAATRLYISSTGNLGLGVTPSAWGGIQGGAFQTNAGATLFSYGTDNFVLGHNVFYNGTGGFSDKYISNGFATKYYQVNGSHQWLTAPSGTAGNAITFTQAMTLDASGRLGIGVSPSVKLQVETPSSGNGVIFRYTGGTNNPGLFIQTEESSKNVKLIASGSVVGGQLLQLGAEGSTCLNVGANNVGLGVTPSAWGGGYTAFQISNSLSDWATSGTSAYRSHNVYYDGTNRKRLFTGTAHEYEQGSSGHIWSNAGSDSSGTNITFTQAMTLGSTGVLNIKNLEGTGNRIVGTDSSGNLSSITVGSGLSLSSGTLSATGGAAGTVTASPNGASSQVAYFTSGTNITGSNNFIWDATNNRLGVGTASPSYNLHLSGSNNTTPFGINVGSNATYLFSGNSTSGYTTTFNINDTGLYIGHNSSSRSLNLQTNSTDRITILGGGNVGIGTTSPNSRLSINGGDIEFNRGTGALGNYYVRLNKGTSNDGGILLSTDNALDWQIDNSAGNLLIYSYGTSAAAMYILRASGNVGIGTTSPSQKLHIFNGNLLINNNASGDTNSGIRILAPIATTHVNWMLAAQQNVANAFEITPSTAVGGTTFSTPTAVFTSDGKVGIGITSPLVRLDARGTAIITNQAGNDYNENIRLPEATSGYASITLGGSIAATGTSAAQWTILKFPTNNNFAIRNNGTDLLYVKTTGEVGIGTTSPSFKTDIFGATLGTAANDYQGDLLLYNPVGNNSYLEIGNFRGAAGSDWTTTGMRLQARIDSTYMGWMQFNGNGNTYGISWGVGGSSVSRQSIGEAMRLANGGNLGIGTISPSTKLDVAGVTRTYALTDVDYRRITNPEGASYVSAAGIVTGAFKIKLPVAKNNSSTMMRMTVKIYTYSTGLSYTFDIGGYNYNLGNWYNIFATQTGDEGTGAFTIRFGYDGTSDCIWIGETNSNWAYPQVYVTDFQAGYSGIDSGWATGWAISLVTSFDTVEQSRAASVLWGSNNDGAGSGLDADLLDGLSTQAAGSAITANQIARSDSNGYVFFNYINSNTGNSENPTVSQVIVTNGSDNYYRKASIAHLTSAVQSNAGGSWGISITGNAATVTNGMYLSGDQNISGVKTFYTPSGQTYNASSGNIGLSVFNDAAGDAMMTFHISGDYAGYFGLGGAENDLVWTGWSVGNNRYRILHTGNYTSYVAALTGDQTIAGNKTFSGITTFSNTSDYQIALVSPDTYAGIQFDDTNSSPDYIWYHGSNQTFAIGGGGSNVSGKKLHIDGGTSIGVNYDATTAPTNGLIVEGSVGIGGSPVSKLTVEGGAANWNETIPGTSNGTIHLDPGSSSFGIGNAITFGAHDSSSGTTAQAGIYVRSDGSFGTTMYFATTDAYITGSKTRMALSNVGQLKLNNYTTTTSFSGTTTGYLAFTNTGDVITKSPANVRSEIGAGTGNGTVTGTGTNGYVSYWISSTELGNSFIRIPGSASDSVYFNTLRQTGDTGNIRIGTAGSPAAGASYNVALGNEALGNITSGYNNAALGSDAGRYITSGSNIQTNNNSVYIGYDSRASANGNTNEIVIGSGSRGNGSNTITLGNSSIGATFLTGGQLTFPVGQNASSDANTLDDYEEGTWTPTLSAESVNFSSVTYDSARSGTYTKIGDTVYIIGVMATSSVTKGSASGSITIGGLPFTTSTTAGKKLVLAVGDVFSWSSGHPCAGISVDNSTRILLSKRGTSNGATTAVVVADVAIGTASNYIYFEGFYKV